MRQSIVAAFCFVVVFSPVQAGLAQTVAEARAFWEEFDNHTLHQMGQFVAPIYGPGDAGRQKLARDIFDRASTYGMRVLAKLIFEAHGRAVPQNTTTGIANARRTLTDNTEGLGNNALQRLSTLQLNVIRAHFVAQGQIDFDKFHNATVLFANGELRLGGAGVREMDQLFQWYIWSIYAQLAIDENVDRAAWQRILPDLQMALEIYRRVYPAPPLPPMADAQMRFWGALTRSVANRFTQANQLTQAQKNQLWQAIQPLTIPQLLRRRLDEIGSITEIVAGGARLGVTDVHIARANGVVQGGNYLVDLEVDVSSGCNPVPGANVDIYISEGMTSGHDGFLFTGPAYDNGDGTYTLSASITTDEFTGTGVVVTALEGTSLLGSTVASALSTDPTDFGESWYCFDPWSANAVDQEGLIGEVFSVTCPANGTSYVVWGTDIYTDDSSVCTAAVHAGVITLAEGGDVVFQMLDGQQSYTGSTRFGITTFDWLQPWSGSYSIVMP